MNAPVSPFAQKRIDLLQQKKSVDNEMFETKQRLERARERAYTHSEFLPREEYRALSERLYSLRNESQALQVKLYELRAAEKRANHEAAKDRERASDERKRRNIAASAAQQDTFLKALLRTLRKRMTGAEYEALIAEAKAAETQS